MKERPAILAVLARRLALFFPPLALGLAAWQRRWTSEDAFISLRVVDNLLAGSGAVYNAGERVEVFTSALWTGIVTLFSLPRLLSPEVVSLILSIFFAVLGLGLAQRAALSLWAARDRGIALPIGAVVVVALPPFWDFSTSGLEMGLGMAWLGGCFWGLCRTDLHNARHRRLLALVVGLGPLIRPDFAIFTAAFLGLVLYRLRPKRTSEWVALLVWAGALPLAYQVFRMGYYAHVIPNPAIYKEAAEAYWSQGLRYFLDLVMTYVLWLPIAAGISIFLGGFGKEAPSTNPSAVVLTAGVWVASGLHVLFIIRTGGDFMHGRLLLPGLFAALMPLMSVRFNARWNVVPAVILAGWAVVSAVSLRSAEGGLTAGRTWIIDERRYYIRTSHHPHPVTIDDYRDHIWTVMGTKHRKAAESGERVLLMGYEGTRFPLKPGIDARLVAAFPNPGLLGYAAKGEVLVIESYGLTNPIGSHQRLREPRGRPGHEKVVDPSWIVARFGDSRTALPERLTDPGKTQAARAALRCGQLAELMSAITGPLEFKKFLRNILDSWRFTRLRIPAEPREAERELCRISPPS